MPLVTLKEVLSEAERHKSAIPAFNIDNIEIVQSLMEAVEEENYPVIFAIGQAAIKAGKISFLADAARRLAFDSKVPVVLHLDHGQSFEQVIQALRTGFSSVMIDGSHLSLEDNIAVTRQTVTAAHAVGVSVEAELGAIFGVEDDIKHDKENLVDVNEVRRFNEAVKVDALAIGIGNAHGMYKGLPNLDFDRLESVNAISTVPLVLHGGSGIPAYMIQKAIHIGIRKINVATEIRLAYSQGLAEQCESKDFYRMANAGKKLVKQIALEKIRLFRG